MCKPTRRRHNVRDARNAFGPGPDIGLGGERNCRVVVGDSHLAALVIGGQRRPRSETTSIGLMLDSGGTKPVGGEREDNQPGIQGLEPRIAFCRIYKAVFSVCFSLLPNTEDYRRLPTKER